VIRVFAYDAYDPLHNGRSILFDREQRVRRVDTAHLCEYKTLHSDNSNASPTANGFFILSP